MSESFHSPYESYLTSSLDHSTTNREVFERALRFAIMSDSTFANVLEKKCVGTHTFRDLVSSQKAICTAWAKLSKDRRDKAMHRIYKCLDMPSREILDEAMEEMHQHENYYQMLFAVGPAKWRQLLCNALYPNMSVDELVDITSQWKMVLKARCQMSRNLSILRWRIRGVNAFTLLEYRRLHTSAVFSSLITSRLSPTCRMNSLMDRAGQHLAVFNKPLVKGTFIKLLPRSSPFAKGAKGVAYHQYWQSYGCQHYQSKNYILTTCTDEILASKVATISYAWGDDPRTILKFQNGPLLKLGRMWNKKEVLYTLCELSRHRWLWIDQFSQVQDVELVEKLVVHLPQYYKFTTVIMLLPTLPCKQFPVATVIGENDDSQETHEVQEAQLKHISTCRCGAHLEYSLKRMWCYQEFAMSSALLTIPCLGQSISNTLIRENDDQFNVRNYFQSVEKWSNPQVVSWPNLEAQKKPLLQRYLTMNLMLRDFKKLDRWCIISLLKDVAALKLKAEYPHDYIFSTFALVNDIPLSCYRDYNVSFREVLASAVADLAKAIDVSSACAHFEIPGGEAIDSSCLQQLFANLSQPFLQLNGVASYMRLRRPAVSIDRNNIKEYFTWNPPRGWTLPDPLTFDNTPKELQTAIKVLRSASKVINFSRLHAQAQEEGLSYRKVLTYLLCLMLGYSPNYFLKLSSDYVGMFLTFYPTAAFITPALVHQSHHRSITTFELWVCRHTVLLAPANGKEAVGIASFDANAIAEDIFAPPGRDVRLGALLESEWSRLQTECQPVIVFVDQKPKRTENMEGNAL